MINSWGPRLCLGPQRIYYMQKREKYPLVSAICIIDKQIDLEKLISNFISQTYENKELIIVNNQKTQFHNSSVDLQARKDIFLIDTPKQVSAGMARNYGISAANGTILAQFDSDHYHHSNRLEAQIAVIAQNDAHMCILSSCLQYSFISGQGIICTNHNKIIPNSMVCVRPLNVDYPDSNKLEEKEFLERYINAGYKVVSLDQPELMCKLITSEYKKNTNIIGSIDHRYLEHISNVIRN